MYCVCDVYIYIYIYIYINIYIYIYAYIPTYLPTCLPAYLPTCVTPPLAGGAGPLHERLGAMLDEV